MYFKFKDTVAFAFILRNPRLYDKLFTWRFNK